MPESETSSATPSLAALLAGGALLGLVFSTRYLFQPFVWANWPVGEVLAGWLEVLSDRLVVGACMALVLWFALRAAARRNIPRALPVGLALSGGAACGELALLILGVPGAAADATALAGRVARWIAVAAVLAGLFHLWEARRAQDLAQQAAERKRHELESQLTVMRLLALQAQIEPHFLFNTLATVQRLAQTRPELGALLLEHLVTFVRLSGEVGPDGPPWTVAQELGLVRAYLGVIEMRMDGRLRVDIETDAQTDRVAFPPLLLATLAENAVRHGIGPAPDGGVIRVSVARREASLQAQVSDTGVGFVAHSGSGIGLANSRARLRTLYGTAAGLDLKANTPHGVVATLHFPLTA